MDARERDKYRGVPLGGIGSGAIELGSDGLFRNITINNNRTNETAIPVSKASFLAIRVAGPDGAYARILQRNPKNAPNPQNGEAPRLSKETLAWRALYPASHYYLNDPESPAQVVWTAFAPIVPFDHDGSSLPALFSSLRFTNTSESPLEISAVFNWENLCGHTRNHTPDTLSPITPACVEEEDASRVLKDRPPAADGQPRFNALEFGSPADVRQDADGHYCLLARKSNVSEVSVLSWDHESAEDREIFWERFINNGTFARAYSRSGMQRSGAVCCSMHLPAKSECRMDFILTWYGPRFEANPAGPGNAYTNRYRNAVEVALQCVKHLVYFSNAVENWQKRILSASLPPWLTRMLVNSVSVFSSNAFLSKDGQFTLAENTTQPDPAAAQNRLYASLGALLFFPRFEDFELARLARNFTATPQSPKAANPEHVAHFVLCACRNYQFTGSLHRIQTLLPALHAVMAAVLALDSNGDGIPDLTESSTYDGILTRGPNSYSSSLWIAALAAYARLTEGFRLHEEAARYEQVLVKARRSFERLFWDEDRGYYRLGEDPAEAACHSGQLAGQWYADFLGLGTLFDAAHVRKALDAVLRNNRRDFGLASAAFPDTSPPPGTNAELAWPMYTAAHFACLLIGHGRIEEALRLLEQHSRNLHDLHASPFNAPFRWDLSRNEAAADNPEHHASALAIWYVFHALCGFELDAHLRCVRIKPKLPPGLRSFEAPVFTPACLGWLQFQEETTDGFLQRIRITFDSPVSIKTIELRVPKGIEAVRLWCEDASGFLDVTYSLRPDEETQCLTIHGKRTLTISGALTIRVANGEPKTSVPATKTPR